MRFTFLMPAYKAAYIREAIQSILNQTLKDFQLIISDDCSPDNIESIVNEVKDDRIVFRRNETNIGGKDLIAHWNILLDIASSEYVILAPDDDLYAPKFLEEIDKLTIKYPNVDVLKCRVQKIDEAGDLIQMDRVYEEKISQLDNIFHQSLPDHMSGIGNYVFKTKTLKEIGGFVNYPLAWWSDVMTNILLSKKGMAITKDILFTMRLSGNSISTRQASIEDIKKKAKATMMCYDDIKRIILSYYPLSKYDEQRMKIALEYFIQWLNDDFLLSASAYTIKEARGILKRYPDAIKSKVDRLVFWKRVIF